MDFITAAVADAVMASKSTAGAGARLTALGGSSMPLPDRGEGCSTPPEEALGRGTPFTPLLGTTALACPLPSVEMYTGCRARGPPSLSPPTPKLAALCAACEDDTLTARSRPFNSSRPRRKLASWRRERHAHTKDERET